MMSFKSSTPDAVEHLEHLKAMLEQKKPFTFVRFSDGETEIIRNRKLEIYNGKTVFRGKESNNKYPVYDNKKFDPCSDLDIRADLMSAAIFNAEYYYKGIPTSHNRAYWDKDLMLRLNGGANGSITFSDLLINSNYQRYRKEIVPILGEYSDVYVISNFRSQLIGELACFHHISIPDNFFSSYQEVKKDILDTLVSLPNGALVLSSASSLSNILGSELYSLRRDITFIDIGTSLNDLLSLDSKTRDYHFQSKNYIKNIILNLVKVNRNKIKW